jgi:3-hydroxymyristoyl/3-hydroxydecanoyl-(acyl carrier protein) dehydratase
MSNNHSDEETRINVQALQQEWIEQISQSTTSGAQAASRSQTVFLQQRQQALARLAGMIGQALPQGQSFTGQPALYTSEQLDAFGLGSIADCLGPDYRVFDTKRAPRIPNSELKLMTRVVSLEGERGQFYKPAAIEVEYDVPADAWFCRENAYPRPQYSIYMEIALQPCGFLSAWLGTMLPFADLNMYFRNLDGSATLVRDLDVRGKTLSTRAELLSTSISGTTTIQKFHFSIACEGQVLYEGESVFGYFPEEGMARQLGLDGGRETYPSLLNAPPAGKRINPLQMKPDPSRPYLRLPLERLGYLDEAVVDLQGGRYGKGMVFGRQLIRPDDWFYACHFHQDPVMPGSLGVEAIFQALQLYAIENNLGARFHSPRFGLPEATAMQWKYRGQIVPQNKAMLLEAHIRQVEEQPGRTILTADASLWADSIRIYEITGASVALLEG